MHASLSTYAQPRVKHRRSSLGATAMVRGDVDEPLNVLLVSQDLETLSSLEQMLEHTTRYRCKAFLAPSHQAALELLAHTPVPIHLVICVLWGDDTYEFAASLTSEQFPNLRGVGLLSSSDRTVRAPGLSDTFAKLSMPQTAQEVNGMFATLLGDNQDSLDPATERSASSGNEAAEPAPGRSARNVAPRFRRRGRMEGIGKLRHCSEDVNFAEDTPYLVLMRMMDEMVQGSIPSHKQISNLRTWLSNPEQLFFPLCMMQARPHPNMENQESGLHLGISDQVLALSRSSTIAKKAVGRALSGSRASSDTTISTGIDRGGSGRTLSLDQVPGDINEIGVGRTSSGISSFDGRASHDGHDGRAPALSPLGVGGDTMPPAPWTATIVTLLKVDPDLGKLITWPGVVRMLERLPQWEMDMFELKTKLGRHSVVAVVGMTVMCKLTLLDNLKINPQVMYDYLKWVGKNMLANPYHNDVHVADVLHSVGLLLCARSSKADELCLMERLGMTNEEALSILFAAAIHDLQHPGVTNDYLVHKTSSLALRYNDRAITESNSASVAFRKMSAVGYGVFDDLDEKTRKSMRTLILRLVAATDMHKHLRIGAKLSALGLKLRHVDSHQYLEHLLEPAERDLLLRCILKMADLGHLVHKTHLHVNFVGLLMQEFFTQGDLLEQEGAPVMSMFRRTDDLMTIARGQCSFFEYIALPFFGSFTEVFPSEWLDRSVVNYDHWCKQKQTEVERTDSCSAVLNNLELR